MIDSNPDARAISSNAEILQMLINSVHDYALILLDSEGRIALWNAGAERLLGWTQAEAVGQASDVFFTPEDQQNGVPGQERQRAAGEERVETERWHLRKDGTRFWANSLLLPLRDGSLRGYVRILRDLSERKTQEQRLEATQTRLEVTLDNADIGTWFYDIPQDRVYADRNLIRLHCIAPEDAEGGSVDIYERTIHPDDRQRVRSTLDISALTGSHYDVEYRVIQPDGNVRWLAARGKALVDAAGEPRSMSGMVMDITAKHAAEAASADARKQARRERLLLSAVLESLPTGVIIADAQGKIIRYNRAFEQIWGGAIMASDVAGYGEYVAYWHETGQRVEAEEWAMARALRGETCPGDVVEIQPFDGSERRVIINSAAPIRDAEGNLIGGVAAEIDVTEQIRAEEALRTHQTQIETLNARLLRSMQETHHRVKNNLQVIAALVEVQDEYGRNPAMQRIKSHARALASIHDMLTYQVKQGREGTQIPVADVLSRLVPSLESVSGGRRIHMEVEDFSIDIQKAASLSLLVNECVSNAIKHSKGNVSLTLTVADERANLTICDDGDGFPSDFDPRKAANTGLELIESAARWDLRGDVRFENAPSGGGRVVCTFPIHPPEPDAQEPS